MYFQSAELPDGNVWCESNVLTHDVTLTLLDAMIRDVNTMSQNVSNTATLKAHHIWTLGLFHRALTRTCGVDPVTSYPPILNLGPNDRASSLLAETVTAADKGGPCIIGGKNCSFKDIFWYQQNRLLI